MQNFHNDKQDIVSEALDGLVLASGGRLARFDPAAQARVVVRAGWDKSKVAVVSGGGSGHEPAHAGLVGKGLLTAAVCGEIFASPSVDSVLSAIIAVTGEPGCLLVVKNYTGDRLNFGLAAEKAKALGLKVEMIVVADDVSIPGAPRPRGLAGTIFIHKIAGFMSEAGRSLDDIVETVERAKSGIMTIGVARDTCRVPGSPKEERIPPEAVEIGLGIHGEPGFELARLASSGELVDQMCAKLAPLLKQGAHYALLFNNLGGLSGLECSVVLGDFMKSRLGARVSHVAGPASVMTALDMPGFSLSLMALDAELETMLLAPVEPFPLPPFARASGMAAVPAPVISNRTSPEPSRDDGVRAVVEAIARICIDMEADINALDAKVGDGDTGSTFATAARAVDRSIDELPFADGAALLSALSDIKTRAMGGSSGVLFAIFLAKSAESYRESGDWIIALGDGLDAMKRYGGARPGDRTMVDALQPALDALKEGAGLDEAARRAREGADATASMLSARAGRSSYLDARSLEGVRDPGAEAIARVFEGLAGRG